MRPIPFHHTSVAVTRAEIASEFLQRWFGFQRVTAYSQSDNRPIYHLVQAGSGACMEVIEKEHVQTTDSVHLGFLCSDVAEMVAAMTEAGVAMVSGPLRAGRELIYFVALPPDGWLIELNDGLPRYGGTEPL